MDKIRVCDLAKKYGITSKELLAFYNDNNVTLKISYFRMYFFVSVIINSSFLGLIL